MISEVEMLFHRLVREWVNERIENPCLLAFKTTAVHRDVQSPDIKLTYKALVNLVDEGKLVQLWEVICPRCFDTLGEYVRISDIPRIIDCLHCDQEIEVDQSMASPKFVFANKLDKYLGNE